MDESLAEAQRLLEHPVVPLDERGRASYLAYLKRMPMLTPHFIQSMRMTIRRKGGDPDLRGGA